MLSSSRNTGKWYNKLYQVPAGVAIGAGTLVEGAVRMVLEPVKNAFLNVRDTGGNFFINIGNALKQTFRTDKPVSDFRFEKIQTKTTSNKNWLSKLAWWKNSNSPATTTAQTSNTTASQAPNSNQLAGLQNQIATLSTQMEQLQSRLSTLQTENQQLKAENQQLKVENQQLKAQAQQTSTQNQQRPTQAQQTSAQNQTAQAA